MRVTKTAVVQTASDIADKKGLSSLSLKTVAEALDIRTPSLYNHIEGLEDLLREVAHNGMRTMNERMCRTAIGKSGDTAIRYVGMEYLNFMIEHPGVYETIQWATWHGNEETAKIYEDYTNLLTTLILSIHLKAPKVEDILNLLTGMLHGYATLQLRYAFIRPEETRNGLCDAMDTLLLGIHQKYDR